ncbi:MAG: A/G-specific adenine glycosylase [Proteobacteria bacterium]|nr:A/G-specific adenine glycosylase [Pseudomonadota bacterium]MBU1650436.1 A/G-specific adenine glycosylase [Pseudomonadota bacterium]MBU1986531.1 A/G-specific adenine glycosylase [Pseudomonadota bacterium]
MSFPLTPLQQALITWFHKEQRELPWRNEYIPYQIWISEIMLQQTQMERATLFFNRWLQEFPDIHSLALASEDKVLKQWEGLGYYSRARNILKCAQTIVSDHNGIIPSDPKSLLTLPGIGPYTAGAIASIAYNLPSPLVDANIGRLFARLFDINIPLSQAQKLLWQKAEELVPQDHARSFNQGLMELGALICTPKNPICPECPLIPFCIAYRDDLILSRPIPQKGKTITTIEMATGILSHPQDKGRLFIQQRLADDVWGSLWEFPGGRLKEKESPEQAVIREFFEETGFTVRVDRKITTTIHHYTRYKVILHCFLCSLDLLDSDESPDPILYAAQEYRWVFFPELADFAFPAGHRKLIAFMQGAQL